MADIFISYAREDRERIVPLVRLLEARNWSVWWDRTIPLGKTFDEVIQEAIDQARCVIVVWSQTSVVSRWVKTEAAEGERRGVLVPVQLDSCQLPLEFRRVQTAQLIGWKGGEGHSDVQRLIGAISDILGERTRRPEHRGNQAKIARPSSNEKSSAKIIVEDVRVGNVALFVGIVALLVLATATIVKGYIAERDIWLLHPAFWAPMLGAGALLVWLRLRRKRDRNTTGKR